MDAKYVRFSVIALFLIIEGSIHLNIGQLRIQLLQSEHLRDVTKIYANIRSVRLESQVNKIL